MAAKKKSLHAAERDTVRVRALRGAFVEAVQQEDFSCFKFVDETSTNLTYCRRYARAEGGQRTGQGVPLHGGSQRDVGRGPDTPRPASGHDRERGR